MRRGDHWVFSTGDIASNAVDWDIFVPKNDSRQGLDLDITQGVTLDLGEVSNLFLGEFDVSDVLGAHPCQASLNLGLGEPEGPAFPVIELLRHFGDGGVTPGFDIS